MGIRRRSLVAVGVAAAMAVSIWQPVSGHPVHDFGGETLEILKGRTYDGVVDAVSPGGVPMEAMSDIRCEDGMAGIFPCHKVDLASFLPLPDIEATFVNDVWGWEDEVTGQQVAIVGTFEGTAFIDVTDGSSPIYLGTLPTTANPADIGNIWGDIRVYGDVAYIVSEALDFSTYDPAAGSIDGFGIQVVDLTQFRGASGPIDVAMANHLDDVSQAHNVSLNEDTGHMYVVGSYVDVADLCAVPGPLPVLNGTGGALIYDVATDPLAPELVGCMNQDGYSHDIHCVVYAGPDSDYQGREICIGSNEDTVTIYDATDPGNVSVIDRLTYYEEGLEVGDIYTHQGWWSEDHSYFFLGDELDELSGAVAERTTFIWDVTDLDAAEVIGRHTDGNTSIDHNMFVLDGLLYQANYTSGLWIYDAWKADQGRVTMRGYFDVFPADDRTDFFGTWGNYPYFGDGKVIVTSSDEGVFVLQSRAKSASQNRSVR